MLEHSTQCDADQLDAKSGMGELPTITTKEVGKQWKQANHSPASFPVVEPINHSRQMMQPKIKSNRKSAQQKTEAGVPTAFVGSILDSKPKGDRSGSMNLPLPPQ